MTDLAAARNGRTAREDTSAAARALAGFARLTTRPWFPALTWALLGVALVDVFFRLSEGRLDATRFFNADALYLPSLYRDLFEEGGRWAGWRLTPAPYVFPDMGLYFLLDALLSPFVHAVLGYAVVQIALLALALHYLIRHAAPGETASEDLGLAAALVAALLLLYAAGLRPLENALQAAVHFSLVPLAAVALALALQSARGGRAARWKLGALCALGSASDGLFIAAFTVPAALCLLWTARENAPLRRPVGQTLRALGAATLTGLLAGWWFFSLHRNAGFLRPRPERWWSSLGHLGEAARELLAAAPAPALIWLGLLAATLAVVVAQRRRWSQLDSPHWALHGVCLYTALSVPVTTGAVVFNGLFLEPSCWRYLVVPLVMPLAAASLVALRAADRRAQRVRAAGLSAAVAVGWGACIARHPWNGSGPLLSSFYPPFVECLDRNQSRYGLGWGVSDYWDAKLVSMFSRTGLRVRQVFHDGSVMYWINNIDWFLERRGPNSNYSFVIVSDPVMAPGFESRFGPPRETFRCPHTSPERPEPHEVQIYVYGDALDLPLRAAMTEQVESARRARSLRW